MSDKQYTVTFQPYGRKVQAPQGELLRKAAAQAGLALDYPCGGQGSCGKCKVRVTAGIQEPLDVEENLLPPTEIDAGVRLACQTRVEGAMVVEIPEQTLLAGAYKILGGAEDEEPAATDSPVRKVYLEVPKPTLQDDIADFERLQRELGPIQVTPRLLRHLPSKLREADWRGTAVIADGHLLDFEPGNTTEHNYTAAFDIGTTTLAATLYDAATGKPLAHSARMNPQTSYGDDVLSRILFASENLEQLHQIHAELCQAVDGMIRELVEKAGIDPQRVYSITFTGNTTMQHLLCELNPAALGQTPFVPALNDAMSLRASDLDIAIHPEGRAWVFPVIGGFVGGDTVAGVLATHLDEAEGPTMLVDIGTNGEIAVKAKGRMIATSCAAGPAFEGARITHGMRAATGAIERVRIDDDVHYTVIGHAQPVGICGSALIDVVAELLRVGIVTAQGYMLSGDLLEADLPETLRRRVVDAEKGPAFIIADASETQTGHAVMLYQKDIRELQLASGAIRAGITIMLRRAGIEVEELDALLVGGGFGNYVRCENAQRIGLLPERLAPEKFRFLGNTALSGARLCALSQEARQRAANLARKTEHIDLSLDLDFQEVFMEAMFFPETEESAG